MPINRTSLLYQHITQCNSAIGWVMRNGTLIQAAGGDEDD